ncbi:MAG: MotA/TolQ/ExbB proton channel family protein [Candidatus Omnitrophica bacterium]|nr:MotA/TolQ/ExbB proton channel family protein [Candidatus Omnitrophota bacterium]
MFQDKNIFEIIHAGGFTMYILILCSILSIAVIIERLWYFKRHSSMSRLQLMGQIRKYQVSGAMDLCRNTDTPCARVALAGLNLNGHDEKLISNAMEREITIQTVKLERFTSIVGTIGGTAVYIGLFGTVLGIIRAFHDISRTASGGIDVVTAGISEALVCTAAGLLVAIPAVISYNYFVRKIDNFVLDMELTASELLDVCVKRK